jgi:ABC-type transport system substrate-binding protein
VLGCLILSWLLLAGALEGVSAQTKPEGEMRWALYVTLSPVWFDPGGAWAYGGYPDVDALFKQQAVETDRKKREAMLHQIQRLVYERVRYGPIYDYIWPSGVGPRVAEPALMLINPYPWSAPLEDVRLKKP